MNGSLYHGPEGEFLTCRLKGRDTASCRCELSRITHLTHIRISTAHLNTSLSEDVFGPEGTRLQNAERYTNYHENSTSVLGPEQGCELFLLSCRLKGRDTTDQNIFVISELLKRITTH